MENQKCRRKRIEMNLVLALDCSVSMQEKGLMEAMKTGAVRLVDRVIRNSGGVPGKRLGEGCRIGVVSFSDDARTLCPLTKDVQSIFSALRRTEPGGSTNHEAALLQAAGLLEESRGATILMLTDGVTTEGNRADRTALSLRERGVTIYGICERKTDLTGVVSAPVEDHLICIPAGTSLEDVFLTAADSIAGKMCSCGECSRMINPPCKPCQPEIPYDSPDCTAPGKSPILNPWCTADQDFRITACEDTVCMELPTIRLEALGRVLRFNTVIADVCPGKRLALGIQLIAVGKNGEETACGLKVYTIPAQPGPGCRDVYINDICFVVPEENHGCCCQNASLCSERRFKVWVTANYLDSDVICCQL